MKHIFIGTFAFIVALMLYFGYISAIGKIMRPSNKTQSSITTADIQNQRRQQAERARDLKERQERLMQDRQTRIRDTLRN